MSDDVHLNSVRATLLAAQDRLLSFPWNSPLWYLAAAEHRPGWMRVDRLPAEHGVAQDTAAGRAEFEWRMEARRQEVGASQEWKPVERGCCLGSEESRAELLARMEPRLGESHGGRLRQESAETTAERIIAEALRRLGWKEKDLRERPKGEPSKVELAQRLRQETTLTMPQIAARLSMGSWRTLHNQLHRVRNQKNAPATCKNMASPGQDRRTLQSCQRGQAVPLHYWAPFFLALLSTLVLRFHRERCGFHPRRLP